MDYKKHQDRQLRNLGLDPEKLTEAQKEIVLQPDEAPENYHHDGEVSSSQARQIWRENMKRSGFTALEVHNLERKIFF